MYPSTTKSDVLMLYSSNSSHLNSTSRITVMVYDSTRSSTAFVDVGVVSASTPLISIDSILSTTVTVAEKFVLSGSISLISPAPPFGKSTMIASI